MPTTPDTPRHGPQVPPSEKETLRVEAFSDGVFAIAITLLVLDLKVPKPAELHGESLARRLAEDWPALMAYLTSFATILVMWVNHHVMFSRIRRSDQVFLFLNGFLLLLITFVPFPTSLVALYIRAGEIRPDARTAGLVYAGTYVLIAFAFNLLWHYAAAGKRLVDHHIPEERIREISWQYAFGMPLYAAACLLAFYSVWASVALCLVLAIFFAFTGTLPERFWKRVVPGT